jgi:threonine/homoserine/homoserine lactone efflux protein
MNYELLTGLMIFALVSTVTSGSPNTLMLMASGANYGFRRSSSHVLGVGLGFALMVILVGVGLTQLFDAYPVSYQVLKIVSVSYLLYLAYRIATATSTYEQFQSIR